MSLRELGKTGVKIPSIGLGCMGMSAYYGSFDEQENIKLLNRSIELGISGTPEYIRQACESSLKRLGVDCIDLYYQHRVDPNTPIEVTVGTLAELVKEGKIKYIGLSECSAATLRRAYKVHPIAAVQMEYSPWTLDIETNGIMEACRELGITIVAYSPLGRGFLTGKYKSIDMILNRTILGEQFHVFKLREIILLLFLVQKKSSTWKKILKQYDENFMQMLNV
ncbi:unnamed protein product [Rhizophagus irregularis]|nr:unnamed protein product [Rhizophagus irregularis]